MDTNGETSADVIIRSRSCTAAYTISVSSSLRCIPVQAFTVTKTVECIPSDINVLHLLIARRLVFLSRAKCREIQRSQLDPLIMYSLLRKIPKKNGKAGSSYYKVQILSYIQ
jgi:hypothetical protein